MEYRQLSKIFSKAATQCEELADIEDGKISVSEDEQEEKVDAFLLTLMKLNALGQQ